MWKGQKLARRVQSTTEALRCAELGNTMQRLEHHHFVFELKSQSQGLVFSVHHMPKVAPRPAHVLSHDKSVSWHFFPQFIDEQTG